MWSKFNPHMVRKMCCVECGEWVSELRSDTFPEGGSQSSEVCHYAGEGETEKESYYGQMLIVVPPITLLLLLLLHLAIRSTCAGPVHSEVLAEIVALYDWIPERWSSIDLTRWWMINLEREWEFLMSNVGFYLTENPTWVSLLLTEFCSFAIGFCFDWK